MRKTCWLSVDYDFFVRSLTDWDWAHKEAPFFRSGFIWQTRVAPFLMQGLDLRDEMDPAKHAKPVPSSFWNTLQQLGYDFRETEFYIVGDSHSGAAPIFDQVANDLSGEPADVLVNFDAHHDLGYCEWSRLEERVEEGRCTCDMWLGALMQWWPTLESRIVFPDWMKEEWTVKDQRREIRKNLPSEIVSRVEMGYFTADDGTVSDIVIKPGEVLEVEAVFVCRSGAWVPPWLDEDFVKFVSDGEDVIGIGCVDPFAESDMPAMKPRDDFDMAATELMAKQWKDVMSQGHGVSIGVLEDDSD